MAASFESVTSAEAGMPVRFLTAWSMTPLSCHQHTTYQYTRLHRSRGSFSLVLSALLTTAAYVKWRAVQKTSLCTILLKFFNSCIEQENTACKLSGVAPATLVGGKDTDNVCMRGSHTFKPPIRTIGRLNSSVADAADRLRGAKTWSGVWQVAADCRRLPAEPPASCMKRCFLLVFGLCSRVSKVGARAPSVSKVETEPIEGVHQQARLS